MKNYEERDGGKDSFVKLNIRGNIKILKIYVRQYLCYKAHKNNLTAFGQLSSSI